MENFTLFVDEAGNTGSKYLDNDQPYFAFGGWFIEDAVIPKLNDTILHLERNYSSTGFELKGKNLSKHLKGQTFIKMVCDEVSKAGAFPLMFLVEKRYMVCGKIVETYLDPFYNNLVKPEELLDLDKRQEIAQEIYDTKSPLIEEFAEAYRLRDVNKISQLTTDLSFELNKLGNFVLSDKIKGALSNINKQMESEFNVFDINRNFDSLNLPMLVAMFQYIEHNLPEPLKIVHDNIDTFKEAYNKVFNLLNNGSEEIIKFKDDRRYYIGLKTINSFTFADSASTPLLRASDYLVSATFEYIKRILTNNPVSDIHVEIAFMSIGGIMLKALSAKFPEFGEFPDLGMTFSSKEFVTNIFSKFSEMKL